MLICCILGISLALVALWICHRCMIFPIVVFNKLISLYFSSSNSFPFLKKCIRISIFVIFSSIVFWINFNIILARSDPPYFMNSVFCPFLVIFYSLIAFMLFHLNVYFPHCRYFWFCQFIIVTLSKYWSGVVCQCFPLNISRFY